MFGRDNDNEQRQGDDNSRFNLGGNVTHGGGYPAGAGVPHDDDDDFRRAADIASNHAGDSGDSSFFSGILQSLVDKKHQVAEEDIDEDDAVRSHMKFFGDRDDDKEEASSKSMGAAAAMQAVKMFSSGQASGSHSQSQLVALAMGEASKLFDKQASQGKVPKDTGKDSAVMQAGEMALKMYLKSQGRGGGASGSSSGGASSLLGMASKFL